MKQANKTERRIRIAISWCFYGIAAALVSAFCLWVGIDPWIGLVPFSLGYIAGRMTARGES